MGRLTKALKDQAFVAFLLFLFLTFLGGVFSGALELNGLDFHTVQLHVPFFTVDYTLKGEYGLWIGVLASSATLAAFLSTYVGKRLFITYKVVDYPADHLEVLKAIKAGPKKAAEIAEEFDVPPSVAQRVLDDLNDSGLLEKIGDGEHTIYYFPLDKERAKKRLTS
jgi:DNA-binding transcriptional ArsR family regulator